MAVFQHHPDGWVRVLGQAGEYIDALENFLRDYGRPYDGLNEFNAVLRYYSPGGTHFVSDGQSEQFLPPGWPEGDAIIQALPRLLAAKAARENPPLPLEAAKAAKWAAVKQERDKREASGLVYLGKLFDNDRLSLIRLNLAAAAARSAKDGGRTGLTYDWTLADNTVLTMTAEELINLPLAVSEHIEPLHGHARVLRDRIEAAATVEELEAIPVW